MAAVVPLQPATIAATSGSKPHIDLRERRLAAAVFDDVRQQGGNGLGFGAAVLEHERGHGKQMRHMRNRRALADIVSVVDAGILSSLREPCRQHLLVASRKRLDTHAGSALLKEVDDFLWRELAR